MYKNSQKSMPIKPAKHNKCFLSIKESVHSTKKDATSTYKEAEKSFSKRHKTWNAGNLAMKNL